MTNRNQIKERLHQILVAAIVDYDHANELAERAGIVPGNLAAADNLRARWWQIIDEMDTQGKLRQFVQIAVDDPQVARYQQELREIAAELEHKTLAVPKPSGQPQPAPAGDHIETIVGKEAQHVVVGKNIVQIIVERLNLPRWLGYVLTAGIALGIVVALTVLVRLLWGLPVIVQQPVEPTAQQMAGPLCPPDRYCVLVADFVPTDNDIAIETTIKIRNALVNADLLPQQTFAVRPVAAVGDASDARRLATQEHALIIIWGNALESLYKELTINFALTDQLGIGESRRVRPYRVESFAELEQRVVCFEACFEESATARALLAQISVIVAYTAAGMLHYGADQPERADQDFLAALDCSGFSLELDQERAALTVGAPLIATEPFTTSITATVAQPCKAEQALDGFDPGAIYYYAGKTKVLTGDFAAGIAYLQRAAERDPSGPAAWIGIADAYRNWLNQSDAEQVSTALEQARQRANVLRSEWVNGQSPAFDLAAVDYELGLIAELSGDWITAQKKYRAAVTGFGANSPDAYVALLALGRAQQLDEQLTAAETTVQQAIALDPQATWAYLELAKIYRNERSKAEQQLELARGVAPTQPYIDIVAAELCTGWQDYDCAIAAFERALERRPDSGWLHSSIGDFYRLHDADLPQPASRVQAADHYEKAVALRPYDPWAHERLALVQYQLDRFEDASAHFQRAVHLVQNQTRAAGLYCNLGLSQERAGLAEAAKESYQACAQYGTTEQQEFVRQRIAELAQ